MKIDCNLSRLDPNTLKSVDFDNAGFEDLV